MHERLYIAVFIQLLNYGIMRLDRVEIVENFGLKECDRVFDVAKEKADIV